jgi:uncharacterized protein (DUF58 family)
MATSVLRRWWRQIDKPGWRSFGIAMAALAVAFLLALYSAAAAETGHIWLAGGSALAALALAGWVAVAIVPVLARRTPLHWLAYQIDYKLTREGMIYIAGIFVVILAALNTGNNLLFMILASMLAGILISGLLSRIVLTGVLLKLELPDHIFAEQPTLATLELRNEKQTLPSFSLRVRGDEKKAGSQILTQAVYFPHIPRQRSARQKVELVFPRRAVYQQDAFSLSTKFPFGFLQKTRKVDSELQVVVYPRVAPTEEFYEILPLISGEIESFYRGRGHDLYSIRDYEPTDSARFVDWKASDKTSTLKVREFTREDELRVLLVLDPFLPALKPAPGSLPDLNLPDKFERAVTFCACLAWHFYEINSEMQFLTDRKVTPMAPAAEIIYDVLHELAFVEPRVALPAVASAQPGLPGVVPVPAGAEAGAHEGKFLLELADEADIFKIILTSQPRGSIPTNLWTSSYFVFLQSL